MITKEAKKGHITFICDYAPRAKKVYLAGTFNDWDLHAKRMIRVKDGTFHANLHLPPGNHEYKFIADGIWLNDPDSDSQITNPYGTLNSVVQVR